MSDYRVYIRGVDTPEIEIGESSAPEQLQYECLWLYLWKPELLRRETIRQLNQKLTDILCTSRFRVVAAILPDIEKITFPHILFDESDRKAVLIIPDGREQELQHPEESVSVYGIGDVCSGSVELNRSFFEACSARSSAFCLNRKYMEYSNCNITFDPELERMSDLLAQQLLTDRFEQTWRQMYGWLDKVRACQASAIQFTRVFEVAADKIAAQYGNRIPEAQRYMDFSTATNADILMVVFRAWIDFYREQILEGSSNAQKIRDAIIYIEQHYTESLNMAMVSNHVSMNYSVFSTEFKKHIGVSFVTYIKEIRLRESRRLLEETNMKITAIAKKVGIQDEKHFMKLFRAEMGVSPTEYRKNYELHKSCCV